MYRVRFVLCVAITLLAAGAYAPAAYADDATSTPSVSLNIRDGGTLVWSGAVALSASTTETISITPTGSSDAISVPRNSVLGVLGTADAAQTEFNITDLAYYSSFDSFLINCVSVPAVSADPRCYNWQYVVSGIYPSVGADDYTLTGGETIYFYFGAPRRVVLGATETVPTIPVVATVQSYDYTNDSWTALSGAVVGATQPNPTDPWSPIEVVTGTTDANGSVNLILSAAGSYNIGLQFDYYATTTPLTVRALAGDEVIVRIRNGDEIGFQGIGHIDAGTTTISDTAGGSHNVSAKSALAALSMADVSSGAFSVSGLDYYDSFGAFYIRCITLATESCDNWQYAVNGAVPGVGADSYELSSGDELYFFYGSPRRVSLSASTIVAGASVAATAETYAPATNTYAPALGYTIGVTQTNPDDPWSPLVVATSSVDVSGHATFGPLAAGTYSIGIVEDFYFPGSTLAVSALPPPPTSGGSGGGGGITHARVDIPRAIAFLTSKQYADGSFGNALLTDWTAIALAQSGASAQIIFSLKNFLQTDAPSGTSATDYERRAMALMALGIDPYAGTETNYISRIVSYFDGTQVGNVGLVNDDIFALFPLLKAGYGASDDIVKKTADFILSKQLGNGSWEESVDLTAAAVQALASLSSISGVPDALTRAKAYLRSQQRNDGGFGNAPATVWAMQAIRALGESQSAWTSLSGMNPEDALASAQQTDGGFEPVSADNFTRVWTTAYAIPAASGKSWNDILVSFPKPAAQSAGGGGKTPEFVPAVLSAATSTDTNLASSTPAVATEDAPPQEMSADGIVSSDLFAAEDTNDFTPGDYFVVDEKIQAEKSVVEPKATTTTATEQSASAATAHTPGLVAAFLSFLFSLLKTAGGFFVGLFS